MGRALKLAVLLFSFYLLFGWPCCERAFAGWRAEQGTGMCPASSVSSLLEKRLSQLKALKNRGYRLTPRAERALELVDSLLRLKQQLRSLIDANLARNNISLNVSTVSRLHAVPLGDLVWVSRHKRTTLNYDLDTAADELFGRDADRFFASASLEYAQVGVRSWNWNRGRSWFLAGGNGTDEGGGSDEGGGGEGGSTSEKHKKEGEKQMKKGEEEGKKEVEDEMKKNNVPGWGDMHEEEINLSKEGTEGEIASMALNIGSYIATGMSANENLEQWEKEVMNMIHDKYMEYGRQLLSVLKIGNMPWTDKLLELLWNEIACLFYRLSLKQFGLSLNLPEFTLRTPCHEYRVTADEAILKTVSFFNPEAGKKLGHVWGLVKNCLESGGSPACQELYNLSLSGRIDDVNAIVAKEVYSSKSAKDVAKEQASMVRAFAQPPVNFGWKQSNTLPYNMVSDTQSMAAGLKAVGPLQVFHPGAEFINKLAPALRDRYASYALKQSSRLVYINGKLGRIAEYRQNLGTQVVHISNECVVTVLDWSDTIDGYPAPGLPLCWQYLPWGTGILWPVWDEIYAGIPWYLRNGVTGPANSLDLQPPLLSVLIEKASSMLAKKNGSETKEYAKVKDYYKDRASLMDDEHGLSKKRLLAMASNLYRKAYAVKTRAGCSCGSISSTVSKAQEAIETAIDVATEECCTCAWSAAFALETQVWLAAATVVGSIWLNSQLLGHMVAYQQCLTRWVIRNEFRFWKKYFSAQVCLELELLVNQAQIDTDILEVGTMRLATMWAEQTRREAEEWRKILNIYKEQGYVPYVTTNAYPSKH